MDQNNHKQAPRGFKREDNGPKNGPSDDLPGRIAGLEKAKMYPEMSQADLAALDRSIAKLKEKQVELLAQKNKPQE